MGPKINIRSIRYSDDIADLIDRQPGRNFTEKFEYLITRCSWELPQKEEQLRKINETIQTEQLKLLELKKRTTKLQKSLQILEVKIQGLDEAIDEAIKNVTQ